MNSVTNTVILTLISVSLGLQLKLSFDGVLCRLALPSSSVASAASVVVVVVVVVVAAPVLVVVPPAIVVVVVAVTPVAAVPAEVSDGDGDGGGFLLNEIIVHCLS